MKSFKDFGIKDQTQGLIGDKIKIDRVLNKSIIVHGYQVKGSKYEKGSGQCLHLQIEVDGGKRVIFTGSVSLINTINQIPLEGFPFQTVITKENERFQFT